MSNKVWDMQSYRQSEEVDPTLKVYECYVNGVRYIVAETSEDNVVVEAKNLYRRNFGKKFGDVKIEIKELNRQP